MTELRVKPIIKLDWWAYMKAFDEVHGGDPVIVGEDGCRLLYRDGWQYSSHDLKGPEFPPPKDPTELRSLKRLYWNKRLELLRMIEAQHRWCLDSLYQASQQRSAPLKKRVSYRDEAGALVRSTADVDLSEIEQTLSYLKEDIAECLENLEKLTSTGRNKEAYNAV